MWSTKNEVRWGRSHEDRSKDPLPLGKATIEILSDIDDESRLSQTRYVLSSYHSQLLVNGKAQGDADVEDLGLGIVGILGDTLDIGSDKGSPVSDDYTGPNPFNGKVDSVVFRLTDPDVIK